MNLLEILKWRYATKAMTGKIVPEETINNILNATFLCPILSDLQPFHIILISNKEVKEKKDWFENFKKVSEPLSQFVTQIN